MFIVRYKNKRNPSTPMYAGGPGLDVNAGVMIPNKSVVQRKNALRFATQREADTMVLDCNPRWLGEVLKVD